MWSSSDNLGFGSPYLGLYHRLFDSATALLYLVLHDLKSSAVIMIVLLLWIGALGTRQLVLQLRGGSGVALLSGAVLILANYTVTNWLIRGAVSEFAFAMLVPWSCFFILRSISRPRCGIAAGAVLGLMVLAHSATSAAYLFLLAIALAVACLSCRSHLPAWRSMVVSALYGLVGFIVVALPTIAVSLSLQRVYDISRIVPEQYSPANQFRPLSDYIWNRWPIFGVDFKSNSVQIDQAVLAGLMVLVITLALSARSRASFLRWFRIPGSSSEPANRLVVIFLLTMTVTGLLLQWSPSSRIYSLVAPLTFLQFPYRLLGVVTPLSIALVVSALSGSLIGRGLRIATWIALLGITLITTGALRPIQYQYIPVPYDLQASPQGFNLSMFGEYAPRNAQWPPPAQESVLDRTLAMGCGLSSVNFPVEGAPASYSVTCPSARYVTLPLYFSPWHVARYDSTDGETSSGSLLIRDNAGLIEVAVPAGSGTITIEPPTAIRILVPHFQPAAG